VSDAKDVAVALTFDFDAFSNWIYSLGQTTPGPLSRGEFGAVGVQRLLPLLAQFDIRATFFTPGHTALAFPGLTRALVAAGHEIAHHGWVHERAAGQERDEERRILVRGCDALASVCGVRPLGYRSPGWDVSPNTIELLLELGFEYESNLMASDFEAYWCRVGDVVSKTEPIKFGRPVPLVEMPVAWHLDDFPYFELVNVPGVLSLPGMRSPSGLLEVWLGEFDYLYEEIEQGVMVLTMHPQVIGRGHRLRMLRTFLEHVASRSGARFTTCLEYARRWRVGKTPSLPAYLGT
jgi:peptidoglycan-N-acetylglucosamine deacetylase